MRVVYLVLIVQVGAQLRCDKTIIHATVGREFNVICKYDARQFLFSKKYWCLGESRSTCEILMDTDGFITPSIRNRAKIIDAGVRGFYIFIRVLQFEDTGIYWAGIDKIYADIMLKIQVHVTDGKLLSFTTWSEAVSLPVVWSVGSPLLTCLGQTVILQCRTERGTNVKYSWFREFHPQDVLLQSSSDLSLKCDFLTHGAQFVCLAQNLVSRERSKPVSLHLLQAGHQDCVYSLTSDDLQSYDCITTTTPMTTTTSPVEVLTSQSECVPQTCSERNHSVFINQTQNWEESFFFSPHIGNSGLIEKSEFPTGKYDIELPFMCPYLFSTHLMKFPDKMKWMPPCCSLIVLLIFLLNNVEEVRGDCSRPYVEGNRILTQDSFKESYPNGTRVTFQCGPGYVTVDTTASRSITCNGTAWGTLKLQCKKKTCGGLTEIPNGKYVYPEENLFGATVFAECNPGYVLEQNRTRKCEVEGWSGSAPVCEVVKCVKPPTIINGNLHPEKDLYIYGDVVTYECTTGNLFGEDTTSCFSDGSFKPSPPECLVIKCEEPQVVNGHRTSSKSLTYKGTMSFECDPGYKMNGSRQITCEKNEWEPPPPKCIGICPIPQCGENRVLTDDSKKDVYLDGTSVTCKCSLGHEPIDVKVSMSSTCSGRQWTKPELQCQKKSCRDLEDFPNGKYLYAEGKLFGAKTFAQCDEGYQLDKTVIRTCQDAGWDGQAPVCNVIKCDKPEVKDGSHSDDKKSTYNYNQRLTFECDAGYKIDGSNQITCKKNGWEPPPPKCIAAGSDSKPSTTLIALLVVVLLLAGIVLGVFIYKKKFSKRGHSGWVSTKNEEENLYSTFNTVIPTKLVAKLSDLRISTPMCNLVLNFLTNRPQSVRLGSQVSSSLSLSTGVPQGCVLSPLLFSLFTHDCVPLHRSNILIKFADDTTVVGRIKDNDESAYREEIQHLVAWCSSNNLHLNTEKTKELIVAFRKTRSCTHLPVLINSDEVERVSSFKFLGIHISEDLSWTHNTSCLLKKAQQRLYFLRRLKKDHLSPQILTNFYRCTIDRVLSNCVTVWYGSSTVADRKALHRVVRTAQRIIGTLSGSTAKSSVQGHHDNMTYVRKKGKAVVLLSTHHDDTPVDVSSVKKKPEVIHVFTQSGMMRMAPCSSLILLILCLLKVAKIQGDCTRPYVGDNRVLTDNSIKDAYPDDTKVTFQCGPGYVTADTAASRSIVCTGNQWTKLELQCKKKTCRSPDPITNGYYNTSEGILFGATIIAKCKPGYQLVGQKTQTCQESGWDGRTPFCEVVRCANPPAINNGDFQPHAELYDYKQPVTYSCMDEFTLIGENTLSCSSNGTFEPSPPVCLEVFCDAPNIVNAFRTEGKRPPYKYKDYVKFECEDGYRMIGSKTLVCEEKGWEPQPLPNCTKPGCDAHDIQHGFITEKYSPPYEYNNFIQYTCNTGYIMSGSDTLQCTEHGWNPHPPHCKNIWMYFVIALVILLVLVLIIYFFKRMRTKRPSSEQTLCPPAFLRFRDAYYVN
ncbi:regulator of complement activation group 2 gene 1 [Trichomycterus rosablanca]|uniref:regulator of complement activation group 2 gene 1 n=1 Tax=Trichomycterus rosablanca TaxID=2290929 RepID=UPI002F3584B7